MLIYSYQAYLFECCFKLGQSFNFAALPGYACLGDVFSISIF